MFHDTPGTTTPTLVWPKITPCRLERQLLRSNVRVTRSPTCRAHACPNLASNMTYITSPHSWKSLTTKSTPSSHLGPAPRHLGSTMWGSVDQAGNPEEICVLGLMASSSQSTQLYFGIEQNSFEKILGIDSSLSFPPCMCVEASHWQDRGSRYFLAAMEKCLAH